MIPKFRAWSKNHKILSEVINIDFWTENTITENFIDRDFDDIILMQSTGLFDKNDQEIFDGDILKSNKYITSVFYEDGAYCVKFRQTPNTTVTMNVISFIKKYKTKIVGNIYENPELLENKGE